MTNNEKTKSLPSPDVEETHRKSLKEYPNLADAEDLKDKAKSGYASFIRDQEKKKDD